MLAVEGGHWSISRSATGHWQTLNPTLASSLDGVLIADVDGNGTDDIARFQTLLPGQGWFEVSWDGRSGWKPFRTISWPIAISPIQPPVYFFTGRFDNAPGSDILFLDDTRFARVLSNASSTPVTQNTHPY